MKKKYFVIFGTFIMLNSSFLNAKNLENKANEQVLNIGNGDDPKTLDPQKCNESTCTAIIKQLFEGLITTDVVGNIIPSSAEKWKVSNDGKIYTFFLKKNLKWSDNTSLTAKDFVYSFRRLVDPKIASEQATLLESVMNASEIIAGKKPITSLGVYAVDDFTLEFVLSKPSPAFFENLTVTNTYPVQEKNVEKYKDTFTQVNNLISNGPYQLKFRKVGDKVSVQKNPYYWDEKNYFIEKINFFAVVDQNTEFSMYEAGQLDITSNIPPNKFAQIKVKFSKELVNNPYLASYVYVLNTQKKPLNNIKLRKALSIAIDRDIITRSVLGMGQKPLYDLVPYGIKNYSQNVSYWQNWPRSKQLEEAKKLYQEAGFSTQNPLIIHILYNTNEAHKKIATSVAAMWKTNLGVQVETVNEEWKTMLDKRSSGDFEILRFGNIANINDAGDFLNQYRSTDPMNDPKYKNTEYDRIVNLSLYESDSVKRKKYLENAAKILQEDTPVIPIYSYVSTYLKKQYINGFEKNNLGKYSLQGVYLQQK
ncbi:peptide ABC transporter substrate-binding protein [Pigmentibacter sp. JX0631]|uniref:peptide ABC transporter substrate-binding protein n=1 Tax=Pigmentibacter sp. JX0631 TaxID=2976982 RepID=UPI0024699157|nr:peptide ABC transporter substrate-binding protein [Pigmentibacter sp. JX0631]WGL59488.1 peptide ABC transporter substrate-binding protein [Pigmentibacter sp. JX0631]